MSNCMHTCRCSNKGIRYVYSILYDTLNSTNYLGEMNADNLQKMILRLPKWAQGGKFAESLKKI